MDHYGTTPDMRAAREAYLREQGLPRLQPSDLGEEPEDVEAQGAIYLHDWLEGLRTTMLQVEECLRYPYTDLLSGAHDVARAREHIQGTLEEIARLIGPAAEDNDAGIEETPDVARA